MMCAQSRGFLPSSDVLKDKRFAKCHNMSKERALTLALTPNIQKPTNSSTINFISIWIKN